MDIIQTTLAIIVALGVLVGIHEWGHFIVARLCGVKVLKFSIGFGQSLYSTVDRKGTEYIIAWIPLGGYVKMVDEREGEVKEEDLPHAFNRKPVLQRIAIVAAGPFINLLFATLVYWFVFLGGQQVLAPVVGSLEQGSIAEASGLQPEERLLAIDGKSVSSWNDVVQNLVLKVLEAGEIQFTVASPGSQEPVIRNIVLQKALDIDHKTDPLRALGIQPAQPEIPAVIGDLMAGEAGARGGLQAGDEILTVNGGLIKGWADWVEAIKLNPGKTMQVELARDDALVMLAITPGERQGPDGQVYGFIGAGAAAFDWPEHLVVNIDYNPLEAFVKAIERTWDAMVMILVSTWKLVVGDLAPDNLGGPIMIAQLAGQYADYGLLPYILFVAYISIVLGVMNLLPIPVLDGGHILFYTIELLIGRPVPEKAQEILMKAGLVTLLLVMSFAIFNDISRLASGT